MTPPRRRSLMQRATIVLGLLLPGFDQVSDAFVFLAPTQARATCAGSTAPPASSGGAAVRSAVGSSYLTNHADSVERRVEGLHRQRYRGQVIDRCAWVYQHALYTFLSGVMLPGLDSSGTSALTDRTDSRSRAFITAVKTSCVTGQLPFLACV